MSNDVANEMYNGNPNTQIVCAFVCVCVCLYVCFCLFVCLFACVRVCVGVRGSRWHSPGVPHDCGNESSANKTKTNVSTGKCLRLVGNLQCCCWC